MNLLLLNLRTDARDDILGFTTSWINEFARHWERVLVITMYAGELRTRENVEVWSLGQERNASRPLRLVRFHRHLFEILSTRGVDACFVHMMPLFAVLAAPILIPAHIPMTLWYIHRSVTPTLRLAEKLVQRVATASPGSFPIPSRKLEVTGHGIETGSFCGNGSVERDGDFVISSVGRIAPIKRLELLVEAAGILRDRGVEDFSVRLVGGVGPGDQGYLESLTDLVRERGLESRVCFVGSVPFRRVLEEYHRADVMVNLCNTGSFDKAVLEAMSCEVPVITSNASFRSCLGEHVDRALVPEDSPAALAEKLDRLRREPAEFRKRMGASLRRVVVERHSLERLVKTLTEMMSPGPVASC